MTVVIIVSTRGGYRTHTSLRTADFESTASTIPPPGQGDFLSRNRLQKYYFFLTWQIFFLRKVLKSENSCIFAVSKSTQNGRKKF